MNHRAYSGLEGVAPRSCCCYTMCIHINKPTTDTIIANVAQMDEWELDRLQTAIDRRRGVLTCVMPRNYTTGGFRFSAVLTEGEGQRLELVKV